MDRLGIAVLRKVPPLYLGIKTATTVMLLGMLLTPPWTSGPPDPARARTVSCVVVNVAMTPSCAWRPAGK